ncbi:xylulokinase [Leucothrix mucor]|uniref:xylulokinase n=1 Tax=Leucothrix mucor TaxID=45248 RepID=UPI0003B49104|nr:xylulokinase [Leucothrix mucor]
MYLGIDLGTSSVKSVLMDADQHIIGSASVSLEVARPHENWSEQSAESWWKATCDTLDNLSANYKDAFAQVKGIGLSGQMHGATLLDASGDVLRPAILWNDGRSAAQCEELEANCPESRELAGNIAMPGFTAPKLLWVKEHEPEIFSKVAKVLLPKDYLRYKLTGEYVSEMSDASGTLWLNVAKRDWSDALLSATGLSRAQMPSLVEGSEASADLRQDLQQHWGIRQRVVVAGGAGDNAAAACGMGTVTAGQAFLSLGTSGVLFVCNDRFSPNTQSAVHAFCHAVPDTWHQMGVILSATDSLQWLSGITGKTAAELTEGLGGVPQAPSSATFLPYLGGERTPHNDANARGAFVGLTHSHDVNALTQSVLEGVAYAFKDSQLALQAAGTDFEAAYAVGGGARSETWLSIIASVLGKPLLIPAGGELGAAFGAARLGLCAAENADPQQICYVPEVERVIEPIAALTTQYQHGYERYKALYPALKGVTS